MSIIEQILNRFQEEGWKNVYLDQPSQIIVNNRGEVEHEQGDDFITINSRIPNVGLVKLKFKQRDDTTLNSLFKLLNMMWSRYDEAEVINFTTATHIKDLMWYEGPLLSHYKFEGKDFFVKWVDVSNDHAHFWIAYEVSPENLEAYLNQQITLATVEAQAPRMFRMMGPINNVSATLLASVTYEELQHTQDQWLAPEEVSIYDPSLGKDEN